MIHSNKKQTQWDGPLYKCALFRFKTNPKYMQQCLTTPP